MASPLQKLLKRTSLRPHRILASLNRARPSIPSIHESPKPLDPSPLEGGKAPILTLNSLQIFPAFPHWIHLEPIPQPGFDPPDADEASGGGDRTVWADSVKKKRKKKMNKHKYRKLRKRLRRKT